MAARSQQIGRFQLLRALGEGLQGKVYLALDPQLRRKVALKLVLQAGAARQHDEPTPTEALHLAELRHPNVVSVYEAGTHGSIPFLVCEFVEGTTLRDLLAGHEPMPLHRSIPLLRGILSGMAHAHARGILHLDLSPSNLMVDEEGVPRVMDFGLSRRNRLQLPPGEALCGALAYMSPEQLLGRNVDARTDVYALGLIAYELLAGRRAKVGTTQSALVRTTIMGEIDFSVLLEADPGGELGAWVRTAAHRDPGQRFADAGTMLEAYTACRSVRSALSGSGGGSSDNAAIEYLLFRIRRRSELPALSNALAGINRMTAPEAQTPIGKLANAILCDYALTNKVLKLASSSFYGGSGRRVRNVSDAIRLLGMGTVRQACIALLGMGQFGDALHNDELVDSLTGSFIAGLVARHCAPHAAVEDREQAFICGLFQSVGRSLAIYHFPREHAEVRSLVRSGRLGWPQAQVEVFGVTYQQLGRSVARIWGFPEEILASMAPWRPASAVPPESAAEGLYLVATFANRLCGIFQDVDQEQWDARYAALVEAFAPSLAADHEITMAVLDGALGKFRELAPILGLPTRAGGYIERVADWLERNGRAQLCATERPAATAAPPGAPAPCESPAVST